jgi:hypothetical protein
MQLAVLDRVEYERKCFIDLRGLEIPNVFHVREKLFLIKREAFSGRKTSRSIDCAGEPQERLVNGFLFRLF